MIGYSLPHAIIEKMPNDKELKSTIHTIMGHLSCMASTLQDSTLYHQHELQPLKLMAFSDHTLVMHTLTGKCDTCMWHIMHNLFSISLHTHVNEIFSYYYHTGFISVIQQTITNYGSCIGQKLCTADTQGFLSHMMNITCINNTTISRVLH